MLSPSTPKRAVNRSENNKTSRKTKAVDTGTPLGVYDTNTVRDRVRQWQSQGGGVVVAEDVCAVEVEEEAPPRKAKSAKREAAERTPTKKSPESRAERSRPSERNARRKSSADDTARSGSAPAKRVVSDAHWRSKRSPPGSATSSRATREATPRKILPDDGIRVKPISEVKEDIRRKRDADKSAPAKDTANYDDGIRVYTTPPNSGRQAVRRKSRSGDDNCNGPNDSEAASSRSVSPEPHASLSGSRTRRSIGPRVGDSAAKAAAKSRRSSQRKEAHVDDSPHSASRGFADERRFAEERISTKSHRGNILSQVFGESKKIFSKQQAPQLDTPRVPSIEAWLSETPDPFVDEEEPPLEIIPPLRPHPPPKREEPQPVPVEDPNKIWDALDSKEGTRRHVTGSRKKKRVPSSAIYEDNPFPADFDSQSLDHSSANGSSSASKLVDITQQAPDLPPQPSSLSRRGATRASSSPTRDRRKSCASKDQPLDDDIRSTVSSAITSSSVEGPNPATPLRPPGLNLRRPFPSTGAHRLSTIASVETFSSRKSAPPPSISGASEATAMPPTAEEGEIDAESRDQFDPNSLARNNSRLAKHSDLISVLSLPRAGNKSIMSARSIRTNRSRLATATIGDLMSELATDESKYMRELRTLVDGVIPVLLTCVLSKTDAAIAAGLFRPSGTASSDPNFTKPIVEMGIALERLKIQHKRIPQQDVNAFMTWAHGAQRVYTDYIKAWRMGFQDVVVNLAPGAEDGKTDPEGLDGGLPRNKDGDVVNGDGERVDVAFLLKRPLVRLKYLAKTLKGISFLTPSHEAEALATKYQNLVIDARNRSNEERARLEDEAASSIDPTRARDPRTLAPLTGVSIDKSRHVRARDHFNLALQHSSGQLVDCRVELLLRDEATGQDTGGDVLICEVDGTGKWLLFPPVQLGRISARNGDRKGEIVVMVRGLSSNGLEWQEIFTLRSDDEEAGFEWVQMLGLTPVPPKILRTQSFLRKHQRTKSSGPTVTSLEAPAPNLSPGKSRTPSPTEMEVPIGEHARGASKSWVDTFLNGPKPSPGPKLQKKPVASSPPRTPSKPPQNYVDEVNDLRSVPSQRSPQTPEPIRTPRSLNEALGLSGTSSMSGLRRTKAKRSSRRADGSPRSPASGADVTNEVETISPSQDMTSDSTKCEEPPVSNYRSLSPVYDSGRHSPPPRGNKSKDARPSPHRSRSSVPSMDLPIIPKIRKESPPTTPIQEPEDEPEWPEPAEVEPQKSAPKLQKKRPSSISTKKEEECPPPAPAHKSPSPVQLKQSTIPVLAAGKARPRRSSSPLKHQYEPSTASESSSESEASTVEHNDATSVSDSSDDEDIGLEGEPTPLMPLGIVQPFKKQPPQESLDSLPNGTLSPSQSASQAPYKTVPHQPTKASKTIASIFSWADNGSWQSLHPDECSIVITPGLIEAFEMSALHSIDKPLSSPAPVADIDAFSEVTSTILTSDDDIKSERPLVALELTPLVPLRRGTAIDISIRSPPTSNSQITSGNNMMFRSRNPEECEALYALINHSRINNPTYIALQNARGPTTTASSMERRTSANGSTRSNSWFGFGRSPSYRASSGPRTPSIAPSESSIGSMSSAFSALKRFSGYSAGGMFNISRSTISSRTGSRANSVYTSSDNSSGTGASGGSGSGTSSPVPPGMNASVNVDPKMGPAGAPLGLSNAKIRLYIRETASKWRDMGSARLTITRPTLSSSLTPPDGSGNARGGSNEKRIVVNGKTKGEVLLDVQLGESCFERVARTGIALSVWEDVVGPNGEVGTVGAVGGVGGGRARVYMIQVCFCVLSLLLLGVERGADVVCARR